MGKMATSAGTRQRRNEHTEETTRMRVGSFSTRALLCSSSMEVWQGIQKESNREMDPKLFASCCCCCRRRSAFAFAGIALVNRIVDNLLLSRRLSTLVFTQLVSSRLDHTYTLSLLPSTAHCLTVVHHHDGRSWLLAAPWFATTSHRANGSTDVGIYFKIGI